MWHIFLTDIGTGLKDEKFIKSKPTRKLKHTNFNLEYFEYFCEMSSQSILIILSYTISKLVRFLRHSVHLFYVGVAYFAPIYARQAIFPPK